MNESCMARRTPIRIALVALVVIITAQVAYSQEAESDRAHLQYEMQKVDPWGPFVLNLLLPFGIGSFVQGDTTGGLIVAGGQVAGAGLMLVGLTSETPSGAMTLIGVGVYSVASIMGLVFPHTYANAANEKLRKDLGIAVSGVSWDERGLTVMFATTPG